MKVIIVGPDSLEKGGISTVINNIYKNVEMTDISFVDYKSWKSGTVFFRIMYSILKLGFFPFFLLKNEADIVYIHFAHNGSFTRKMYYSKIAKLFKIKVVFHSHSSSFDLFYQNSKRVKKRKIQRTFQKYCDCLIVLGESWKHFYCNSVNVPVKKISILHNAVSVEPYYIYNSSSSVVTMFGRLGHRKGTYDILEVAKKFQKNKRNVYFKLYGDGDIQNISAIIQRNQLTNVSIEGWVRGNEKTGAMKEAILNILPSYNEGMPMAILESMALGIPNISTNIGSIEEVIIDENNGFIINPGDVDSLYTIIENYIYSSDIVQKDSISRAAHRTIVDKFNMTEYGSSLYKIFEVVLSTK